MEREAGKKLKEKLKDIEKIIDLIIGFIFKEFIIEIIKKTYEAVSFIYPFLIRTAFPILATLSGAFGLLMFPSLIFKIIGASIIIFLIISLYVFYKYYRDHISGSVSNDKSIDDSSQIMDESVDEGGRRVFVWVASLYKKSKNAITRSKEENYSSYFLFILIPSYMYSVWVYLNKPKYFSNVLSYFYFKSFRFVFIDPLYYLYKILHKIYKYIYNNVLTYITSNIYDYITNFIRNIDLSFVGVAKAVFAAFVFIFFISIIMVIFFHAKKIILYIIDK